MTGRDHRLNTYNVNVISTSKSNPAWHTIPEWSQSIKSTTSYVYMLPVVIVHAWCVGVGCWTVWGQNKQGTCIRPMERYVACLKLFYSKASFQLTISQQERGNWCQNTFQLVLTLLNRISGIRVSKVLYQLNKLWNINIYLFIVSHLLIYRLSNHA